MEILLVWTSVSKRTLIVAWILKDDESLWVSLNDGFIISLSLVAVVNLSHRSFIKLTRVSRLSVWHFDSDLPWPHTHTILCWHPVLNVFSSLHLHDLNASSISLKRKIVSFIF
jgi:hypothetical protein